VPPRGTTQCEEIHIKQLLTPIKFEFVARMNLKLWHANLILFGELE